MFHSRSYDLAVSAVLGDDSPGRVTEKGIAGDVVGGVVTRGGLSEVYLQMTSFAAVPDSRTWFPEHLKGKQEKTNKKYGEKNPVKFNSSSFYFYLLCPASTGAIGLIIKSSIAARLATFDRQRQTHLYKMKILKICETLFLPACTVTMIHIHRMTVS